MHSIRQSCHILSRTKGTSNGARRAFSLSAVHRRGAVPVYLEPSTPELAALLQTVNSKVLLPHHLTKEQQKLVYKPENRAKLETEPIEITLGDVTLPLEHINVMKDIPRKNAIWVDIVKKSKSSEDWENVLRLMEGFANAGIPGKTEQLELVVRKLSDAGKHHLILKALQRPEATGLRLKQWSVLVQVLKSVRDKAWKADWDKEELKKALSMAEQVVELMEKDAHASKGTSSFDHRTHPAVIAVPLEMAAELAFQHDASTEKVKRYAVRLMESLKQHDFLRAEIEALETSVAEAKPENYARPWKQSEARSQLAMRLIALLPVWNGLSTTRTVLDNEMPMAGDAERVQQQLRQLFEQGAAALELMETRDGKRIAKAGPGSYSEYFREAISACEDEE